MHDLAEIIVGAIIIADPDNRPEYTKEKPTRNRKLLLLVLIVAALVATYYWPQLANKPPKVKETYLNKPDIFESKEECHKAVEKYTTECFRRGGSKIDCMVETYCDSRGCC